jgi:hypothetical protein
VARNPGVLRVDLSSPTYTTKLRFVREVLQVVGSSSSPAFACCMHGAFIFKASVPFIASMPLSA